MAITLDTVTVTGTPQAMGQAQGEAFRTRVQAFVANRLAAMKTYGEALNHPDPVAALLAVSAESLAIYQWWHPEGWAEHQGIADGAQVDSVALFAASNMTDMRDAFLLNDLGPAEDEGCTAVLIPSSHTAHGRPLAGQTWDLNPPDVDYIVAIHRKPTAGPQTWSVTCAGCLTLMGINEHGVAVGTTNLKVWGSEPGVGYLNLLHRALTFKDAGMATAMIQTAPRSGAHTFWLADPHTQMGLETGPRYTQLFPDTDAPIVFTNHCQTKTLCAIEGGPASPTSIPRLHRMTALAGKGGHTLDSLKAAFSDRSEGIRSINRYAEDNQGGATNAVFIADPQTRTAWACRGPADRGTWIELGFA